MWDNLAKEKEKLSIDPGIKNLFKLIYDKEKKQKEIPENDRIVVSEVISKMSFYYEKVRNLVDYKEEHLHRKSAIARILKRFIIVEGIIKVDKSDKMAKNLLIELIRGGYLPNNAIPESKITEVGLILEKNIELYNKVHRGITDSLRASLSSKDDESGESEWLIGMMASEVESVLSEGDPSDLVVASMFEYLVGKINLPFELSSYEDDLRLQIYLSIHRTYLKYDRDMLAFIVFKYSSYNWDRPSEGDMETISGDIDRIKALIDYHIKHPLTRQLDKIINPYAVYYRVLFDIISENPVATYKKIKENPESFATLSKKAFMQRYRTTKARLWKSGLNSVAYIFITKSVFVVLLEIPLIKYLGEEVNAFSLAINILFPALLMFLVTSSTRVSSEKNNQQIVKGVEEIVFTQKNRTEPIILKKPSTRSGFTSFILAIFYAFTYFISFGVIVWVLSSIGFNWVSIVIFLFFLAFVSFFSIRIRHNVRQLIVVREKENIVGFLADFFFVPIVGVGKWLSAKFNRLNVFVLVMDFVIETPFKFFVEITEQWTRYVKERKEDMF